MVLRDGGLAVRDVSDPEPGPGELLCRTLLTATCASDVHFMDHPELGIDDPTGRSLYDPDRNIVLGHEFVGTEVGHGPGCTDQFPVGTRVTSISRSGWSTGAPTVPASSGSIRTHSVVSPS